MYADYAVRLREHRSIRRDKYYKMLTEISDCLPVGVYTMKELGRLYKRREWTGINMLLRRVIKMKRELHEQKGVTL